MTQVIQSGSGKIAKALQVQNDNGKRTKYVENNSHLNVVQRKMTSKQTSTETRDDQTRTKIIACKLTSR